MRVSKPLSITSNICYDVFLETVMTFKAYGLAAIIINKVELSNSLSLCMSVIVCSS